jgi:hypothetical protein
VPRTLTCWRPRRPHLRRRRDDPGIPGQRPDRRVLDHARARAVRHRHPPVRPRGPRPPRPRPDPHGRIIPGDPPDLHCRETLARAPAACDAGVSPQGEVPGQRAQSQRSVSAAPGMWGNSRAASTYSAMAAGIPSQSGSDRSKRSTAAGSCSPLMARQHASRLAPKPTWQSRTWNPARKALAGPLRQGWLQPRRSGLSVSGPRGGLAMSRLVPLARSSADSRDENGPFAGRGHRAVGVG